MTVEVGYQPEGDGQRESMRISAPISSGVCGWNGGDMNRQTSTW